MNPDDLPAWAPGAPDEPDPPETRPVTILDKAAEVTAGDRNRDYGHPADNHECTAEHWRLWVKRRYGIDIPFDGLDVCAMNTGQKLSRLANTPDHRDSLVDIAGYARNWEMVLDRKTGKA